MRGGNEEHSPSHGPDHMSSGAHTIRKELALSVPL